ncbi:DUF4198 domain-containing protein [Pseudofulvimonas gallinarii]|uniref:Putative GH25 family protein n=1 Tax=Pseudofulvimonas gallinarii TaxID=634155 RepID=A0A4S3L005_9GAMM|nr:DUF4198 domain-containing protein [Pseudofulvimonas gallinarii]TCT01246.1 putative GH25 family protein [Pseudofulvimonas gallinarii]THD15009.1 ABC transporter permease [Pseudofulvimonas gallinarii]
MNASLRRLVLVVLVVLPLPAFAHKAWLLPSATVLSEGQWITVDGAVSNDLFYFNHVPLRLDNLVITRPDGSAGAYSGGHTGKYRSVFDVELDKPGTWRLAIINEGLFASWTENGESKRWRGSEADLAKALPVAATDVQVTRSHGRIETFVTAGAPTTAAMKLQGSGLELVHDTHPNDLYAGETTRYQFLLDGKPAADVEVEIVAGATRYRSRLGEKRVTTDAEGRFEVTWSEPGMYWLEASASSTLEGDALASQRRASHVVTLEVLPQ